MEKRQFGKTDMQVSALGFGGAEIGKGVDVKDVADLLNVALNQGLNVIDTAACYNSSEELIGKAVSHRRSDFYLFTKCGHSSGIDLPDWDPKLLEQSIDRSLRRLGTDYVDLLQLHSCSEEILRRGEVIEVLQKARDAGKARYIGYSGDRNHALYAVQCGAFDSLQTSVNIADQEAIELTIGEAKKRGMGVIAKRPIANAAWRHGVKPDVPYWHTYWERLQTLNYDFLQGDLSQSVAVALKFTLAIPGVSTAIVGTSNPKRWEQNAALIAEGRISNEQYEAIRKHWHEVEQGWNGQN